MKDTGIAAAPDPDLLWHPEKPEESEKTFRSQLAELMDPEGSGRAQRVELLTQIARAEAAQGKLSEAFDSLQTASKLLRAAEPALPVRAQIRLLLEEGRLLALQRTPSQSRTRFSEAWELAVNAKEDFFVVEVARAMAGIEPLKLQETWIRKAIEIAEVSEQETARSWLGALYEDLGWRLFDLRRFEDSLAAHQKALAAHEIRHSKPGTFRARWAIGRLLRQLRRYSEALKWNQDLLLEMLPEGTLYGRLCEEIGECLLSSKKADQAQAHFARAYGELSRPGVDDRHPLGLKRLKQLGKVE